MRNNKVRGLTVLVFLGTGLFVFGQNFTSAVKPTPTHINSFQVMNVCVDGNNKIIAGLAPGDPGCTRQRDIRNNEAPPYRIHTYRNISNKCSHVGPIARVQIPVTIGGVTRNVSYTDRGASSCDPKIGAEYAFGRVDSFSNSEEGYSIQSYDETFGFTMASWSPVSTSYWITDQCEANKGSVKRMYRGWVIAPANLSQLPIGGKGTAIVGTYIQNPELYPNRILALGQCPKTYNKAYTSYFRNFFAYGRADGVGKKTLDSIISHHYPTSAGNGPGKSENYERTYWTDEFGLSRWEKWATDSYTRQSGSVTKTAKQISIDILKSGVCSKSYDMPVVVTSRNQTGLLVESLTDGVYEDQVDPGTGVRLRFYRVYCNDYTNIVRSGAPGLRLQIAEKADTRFWGGR